MAVKEKWKKYVDDFRSQEKSEQILSMVLVGLLLLSIVSLTVFTLVTYRHRFHSDAATEGMIAMQQIEQGKLLLSDWYYSQDFWPFFVFNPFVLLFPVLQDGYLATQIPVLLQSYVVGFLTWRILQLVHKSKWNLLVVAFVFSGVSYYWTEFFWGQGQYGNVLMWILLCIWLILVCLRTENRRTLVISLVVLFIVNAYINTTSVRYLAFLEATAIGALVLMVIVLKDRTAAKKAIAPLGVMAVSAVAGIVVFGLLKNSVHFIEGNNGSAYLSSYEEMLQRIPALLSGFLKLICDPSSAVMASLPGVIYAYRLLASLCLFALPIAALVLLLRKRNIACRPAVCFIGFFSVLLAAVTLFSMLTTSIDISSIAAQRYLMISVYIGLLLLPVLIEVLEAKKPAVKFQILAVLVVAPLCLLNMVSMNRTIRQPVQAQQLIDELKSEQLTVGYASYWNADSLTVLSNFDLEIYHIDVEQLQPHLFMSSKKQYESTDQQQYFLLLTQQEYQDLDTETLEQSMGLPEKTLEIQNYIVLVYRQPFYTNLWD